ncbi:MAG: DEAD/DEAH box helicase, partial [Cytophagaceae bacterium]
MSIFNDMDILEKDVLKVFESFHPAVSGWFKGTFGEATQVQAQAWPEIRKKKNTLIAAPTGSGKTLAAFLASIDDLICQGIRGNLPQKTQVVYISPLKALSNDIEKNLQIPLKGIREELQAMNLPDVELKVSVRTGDTSPAERTGMIKNPPHILVTTPESLYLMLTSKSGREMLSDVTTLIVDEIHALVGSKRGSHMALSIERLEHAAGRKLVRVGLSATQKPIEKVAAFLAGSGNECTIVDTGHRRKLELAIEVPQSPLTAVMAHEVWGEIYERLVDLINEHKTTLIFVNTRRLAERIAFHLTEKMGGEVIMAHHGSMSRENRLDAEQRLKSGTLKALVATASLELGIDIGDVDLVCQIGSPKSIAAFLQRVGRSGHSIKGTPKGFIFPLTRDELVECTAILDAVRRGELDKIIIPEKPVDVLAQQIVAEVASEEWEEGALYELVKKAYPYRDLQREEYDIIIGMLADGFTTRKGRKSAYLHQDIVHGMLRPRKGARLTAIVSGGAIPDNFDYDVVREPENIFVGTLNEDFAIESLPGDIFQLGNTSYRILRIENGKVRVQDAAGEPPSLPFWLGEAPGRTAEFSAAVSRLRQEISDKLGDVSDIARADPESDKLSDETWKLNAMNWLIQEVGVAEAAADQLVTYLGIAKAALGILPTQEKVVLERFFDEAGDMHMVVHSPFGSRLNRAWGLALRKRFCKKFNFELQAAATEDAIVLSLGSTHSFPLEEVFGYLKSKSVRNVLIQALLDSPMFGIRWRWNASTALAVLRRRAGERVPPQIQRMNAEDLVALVFPDSLACFENIPGEREVPDHPLVNQTIHDCLTEAMDIDELEALLVRIERNEIEMIAKDLREPSPLSQEILNARPYAFLDDAPLEERRTRAVMNRRWLDPSEASDLGKLDIAAIEAVRAEAWPQAGTADELQDALALLGFLSEEEGLQGNERTLYMESPLPLLLSSQTEPSGWSPYFKELVQNQRASVLTIGNKKFWIAPERYMQLLQIYPEAIVAPQLKLPERYQKQVWNRESALVEIIRGRLESSGPILAKELAAMMDLPLGDIDFALLSLEQEGFIFRGKFTPGIEETEWCERRLLARIHRYTLERLRREIEPVSSADFMRFQFSWQHLDQKKEGILALEEVLKQLEGYEAAAASWEGDILPARIADYDHTWLDMLCLSGKIVWGRYRIKNTSGKKSVNPVKTTPVMLVNRSNAPVWSLLRESISLNEENFTHPALLVSQYLTEKGACFFDQIADGTKLFKVQVEDAIAELVAAGLITSDSYTGLRALLVPSKYRLNGNRKQIAFTMEQAGRWALPEGLKDSAKTDDSIVSDKEKEYLDLAARSLLRRYGVVFRKIADHEHISPAWRDLVRYYRTMEARGEIRGGRFVDGVWGEQFALSEAVASLRQIRKEEKTGRLISLSASDPLNMHGLITPGKKLSAYAGNRILYKDGVPVAILESDEVKFLADIPDTEKWALQNALIRRDISPKPPQSWQRLVLGTRLLFIGRGRTTYTGVIGTVL